jgi:hypothetical protein
MKAFVNAESINLLDDPKEIGQFQNAGGWLGAFLNPFDSNKDRKKRETDASRAEVNARYPATGSCVILTNSSERLDEELSGYVNGDFNRVERKVAERMIPILEEKQTILNENTASQCASEGQQSDVLQGLFASQKQAGGTTTNPTTALVVGGVVLVAVVFGIYKIIKR